MGKQLASRTMISSLIKEKNNHAWYILHFIGVNTGKLENFLLRNMVFIGSFKVVVTRNIIKLLLLSLLTKMLFETI